MEASGVYAVRDRRSKRVLYVGESHSDRLKYTLTRKFQSWDAPGGGRGRGERGHRGSITLGDPSRVEVRIWYTSREEALPLEEELRFELDPKYNPWESWEEEASEVPF